MKFGLSFLPDANSQYLSARLYYKNILQLAKMADDAGLNTIKITEHYLHPYGGYCPDPLIFLASVAASTKHIRLMTGGILPAFHHPVQIAAKTAMLDVISNGRLDVGFARAYLPHEFTAFQISMDESRDRFEQTIAAVIKLWTEENVNIDSPYFKIVQANSLPKAIQFPHPPVWIAAVMSRQSFARVGENGFHLLVTPSLKGLNDLVDKINIYINSFQQFHSNRSPYVTLSMPLLIAETSQQAIQLSNQYLTRYLNIWSDATKTWTKTKSVDYPGYEQLTKILTSHTAQKMRQQQQAFVGSPNQIIDLIDEVRQKLEIDQFIWQVDFGAQPEDCSYRSVRLFIDKVLPFVLS